MQKDLKCLLRINAVLNLVNNSTERERWLEQKKKENSNSKLNTNVQIPMQE